MYIKDLKKICKPYGIQVECRWGGGFQVFAKDEKTIYEALEPLGFEVKGIGIGYSYLRQGVILFVKLVV